MKAQRKYEMEESFAPAANDPHYGVQAGLAIGLTVAATMANAAIDTAGIITGVTDAATAVGVIGAAVVLVVLGIKTFKWVARSL